jgi:hypothetical protein
MVSGNKTVYHLARQVSSLPLSGPEPALGISGKVMGVIRGWTRSIGSLFNYKGRLRAFFKDSLQKSWGIT